MKTSESEQLELISRLETTIEKQTAQIAKLEALVRYYEEQFKLSQRRQFGTSNEQSPERYYSENWFNEVEDQADASLPEPIYEEVPDKRKKHSGKELSRLPIERVDYELPESERICHVCGETMRRIGITVCDEIEVIAAKIIHKEHAVHIYGCAACEKNSERTPIFKAKTPVPLINGSLASPSAVAHIVFQKFVNGVPLHRQEKGFAYDGLFLPRQTMANWLIYCTKNYLSVVYSLLIGYLLKEDICHAGETAVQALHEPNQAEKTQSYERIYRTNAYASHHIVIFEYLETCSYEHTKLFFKDFKGYLQTDGYHEYDNLHSGITVVGCWSHARRYWERLYKTIPAGERAGSDAECGLVYINLLFMLEDEYRDMSPKERYTKRLKCSKPVSDNFFKWTASLSAPPQSRLTEAITYAASQRKHLENVYLDGRLELSNNRAERAIKPFVKGRKVWMFSDTPYGAESSSILCSLIETAKENLLNPMQYIKFLLERLPTVKPGGLEALLPWSESLPASCRVPAKTSNPKNEKPIYSTNNDHLHLALLKLREKYSSIDSI